MWTWCVIVLLACGSTPSDATPAKPAAEEAAAVTPGTRTDVTVQEFAELHAKGVTLIDVRTPAEVKAGHVPGIVHVPLSEVGPDHASLKGLSKTDPIYFICAVGGRSGRAADLMSAAGFNTVNVVGGTNGWVAAGHPVEKD